MLENMDENMDKNMRDYMVFRNQVNKYSKTIKCPMCDETLDSSGFEDHCKKIHSLDPLILCVFCRNVCWLRSQKMQNGTHLKECHNRFKDRYNISVLSCVPIPPEPTISTPSETICLCSSFRSENLCRRTEEIPDWSPEDKLNGGVHLMYKPMFTEKDDYWCSLPDHDNLLIEANQNEKFVGLLNPLKFHPWSGLDDAVKWIHRYLYYEKRFGWYHVCVRAGCMKSFVNCLKDLKIVELPYGCVCKGRGRSKMSSEEALKLTWQHHRHAILVVKDKLKFKQCLEKYIRYDTGEIPENGKRYYCAEIKDVNHLISSIAYVSQPKAKCKCDEIESKYWSDNLSTEIETLNSEQIISLESLNDVHYYIFKPVIPHAVIWMLLVVPGALERYCKFRVGSRSVYKMDSKVKCNGQWYVSACEELGIRNCPVIFDPIDMRINDVINPSDMLSHVKNYQSTDRWFVYWFGGKVLKVTKFDDGPSHDNLKEFQEYCFENKINTMFNFRENLFLLPCKGQRHANDLYQLETKYKPYINKLESEQETLEINWQKKYDVLETKWQNKYNALETMWQNKYDLIEKKLQDEQENASRKYESQEINWKNKLEEQGKKISAENNIHLNKLWEVIRQIHMKIETQNNMNEEITKKRKLETDLQDYKTEEITKKGKSETDLQDYKTEEIAKKRKLEPNLQDYKNKFQNCFSELETIKKEFKTLRKSEKKELKDYKKKLDISEAKFEKFRNEKYLPLIRDLNNARRREKRLRTKT